MPPGQVQAGWPEVRPEASIQITGKAAADRHLNMYARRKTSTRTKTLSATAYAGVSGAMLIDYLLSNSDEFTPVAAPPIKSMTRSHQSRPRPPDNLSPTFSSLVTQVGGHKRQSLELPFLQDPLLL